MVKMKTTAPVAELPGKQENGQETVTPSKETTPKDGAQASPGSSVKSSKAKSPSGAAAKKAGKEAKSKAQALDFALDQIQRKCGQGSIMFLGADHKVDVATISTGALSLDVALGVGGVPRGRIVEIYGPESSGKTTLTLEIIANAQKTGGSAGFIDAEHALDPGYARKLGVNLDTLLAMPQNYYLYLHPKTGKFIFFPWDLDICFAGWPLGGPPAKQMNLSLIHPHSSDEHKLIDRLFGIESIKSRYYQIINELVSGAFSKEQLLRSIHRMEKTIQHALEKDTDAVASRNERGYPAPLGYRPPNLRKFIDSRMDSIKRQLDGRETEYVFVHDQPGGRLSQMSKGGFGGGRLARHMLSQGDSDKDQMLSKDELVLLLEGWFDAIDGSKSGEVDKLTFFKSLPDAFFPKGGGTRRPPGKIPETYVAEGLFSAADSDRDGMATKQSLTNSFVKWFDKIDRSNQGKIGEKLFMVGLWDLISMTRGKGQ